MLFSNASATAALVMRTTTASSIRLTGCTISIPKALRTLSLRYVVFRHFSAAEISVVDKNASTLEVEMKFRCTPSIMEYCTLHATKCEEIKLSDTYFDNAKYELTKRDLWLRSRNRVLELKAPPHPTDTVPSSQQQSQTMVSTVDFYQESTELTHIADTVLAHTGLNINFVVAGKDTGPGGSSSSSSIEASLEKAGLFPFGTIASHRRRHSLRVPISPSLHRHWSESEQFQRLLSLSSSLPNFQDVFVDLDFVKYQVPPPVAMAGAPITVDAIADANADSINADGGSNSSNISSDYVIGEIEFVNAGLMSMLDASSEGSGSGSSAAADGTSSSHSTAESSVSNNNINVYDSGGADLSKISFQQALMRDVCETVGITDFTPVRGKVLEYLHRHRPAHYQALQDCGQLASKGIIESGGVVSSE